MKHRNGSFTSAPIGRTMISTAISMLPGTLAISGYNIADTYFVGQLHNTVALAAMGYTFPVIMIIGCIFRGLATGIMATAAQALGGAKHGKAAKLITSGLCLTLVLSIICGLLGAHYIDWTFHQFGAQDNVMPYIRSYMVIWYWGVCTAALTMSCNDILMAAGSTKIASGMMVAGMLINVILDPIFIFGFAGIPAMGIAGAAWATVLSQAFAAAVMLLILHFRYRFLTFVALQWRFLKNTWLMITRFAIPSMFGMLLMPIGNGVVTWVLSQFGDEAVAASAAAGRLEVVAFFLPDGAWNRFDADGRAELRCAALFENQPVPPICHAVCILLSSRNGVSVCRVRSLDGELLFHGPESDSDHGGVSADHFVRFRHD